MQIEEEPEVRKGEREKQIEKGNREEKKGVQRCDVSEDDIFLLS